MEAKPLPALVALFILIIGASPARAISPQWRYRVLRSAHFEMIFREEQRPLARHYLIAAERAYATLLPIFKEAPSSLPIILQDDTDSSNAIADFLPYPHISVYPVLPSTLESIDDYGDWAYELILHEYTHILNMYPSRGVFYPLSFIFGGVMRPNMILPTWYLEGLAVDLESHYSDHGRLRASETLASARALLLDDKFQTENLARVNELGLSTWPYGSRPYLYGGWWWQNVHTAYGVDTITKWNDDFARRFPFLLNAPMETATGKGATALFNESLERQRARATRDLAAIDRAREADPQAAPARDLTGERGEVMVFALSPSGNRLVYWAGGAINNPGTRVMLKERTSRGQDFADIKPRLLFRAVGATRVSWVDDDRFVYDGLDLRAPWVSYRDLYLYDFANGKSERLTKGLRAEQPAVSPDRHDVIFVRDDGGRNHLDRLNLETRASETLLSGNFNQRISSPEYSGAKEVLYIMRQRAGDESVHAFDLQSRRTTTRDFGLRAAQNLRRVNGGFLVTDAGMNVRNAYWIRGAKLSAVTNTETDIETADYDPQRKEVLYSELTGLGHRLRAETFLRRTPPKLAAADIPPSPPVANPTADFHETSYQPFEYLRPRYWIPFIYQAESGLVFQGQTEVHDPAFRNGYTLLGSYDTLTKRLSYGGSYTNQSLPTAITLGYDKAAVYLAADQEVRDTQAATLDLGNFWPFNDTLTRWTVGGAWLETAALDVTYRRIGPTASFTHSGLSDPLHPWYMPDFQISHAEFLKERGYVNYGRSAAQLLQQAQLARGNRVSLVTRAVLEPKLSFGRVAVLGEPNIGGNYSVNLTNSNLLLRGYPSGEFLGKKVLNANLEWSLPFFPIEKGWGTFPMFLQNLEAVLFTDVMSVDGVAIDKNLNAYVRRNLSQFSLGSGGELRLTTDTAYKLPLSFTVGLYYGFDTRFNGGLTPFFGVGMGTLSGLQHKTP